jgi:predicted dithiol-disulfide oxidoreductase (DUF899 family)
MSEHRIGTREEWGFPWVSRSGSDFPFDFGLALTEEQMADIDEVQQMIERPPDWLQDWSKQVGADLEQALAEGPGWIAFALEDGVVYHTYTRMAPDRDFVVPYYHQLLDRTPKDAPTSSGPSATTSTRTAQGRVAQPCRASRRSASPPYRPRR